MDLKEIIELIISSLTDIVSGTESDQEIPEEAFNELTYLLGPKSFIDSLSLVSLIVDVEQKLSEKYGVSVTIADEKAMSQERSPFRTIKSLADYIISLINEINI